MSPSDDERLQKRPRSFGYAENGAGRLSEAMLASLKLLLTICGESLSSTAAPEVVATGTAARRERLVQRFLGLIEGHFREGWTVPQFAKALGASTPTLTRSCQASLGRSPGDLVSDRVQLEAMRALTYSAASIARIAHDLGFEDPAYFARFFKARAGMTASQFRSDRAWFSVGRSTESHSGPVQVI